MTTVEEQIAEERATAKSLVAKIAGRKRKKNKWCAHNPNRRTIASDLEWG